jgi:hypothetical protein
MVTRICVLAVLLAGCAGPQLDFPSAFPQTPRYVSGGPSTTSGTGLLYVADQSHHHGQVDILALPSGKRFATISPIGAFSPCADALGDVWVPAYVNG